MNTLRDEWCSAWIHDDDLPSNTSQTRRCAKKAIWYMADSNTRGICSTHKRTYDTRKIR